ncbi:MAG: adenine deaminase, partial [Eggerthellaceae bacterium]|nr:adenine deaminase [Eggerthellaceae bacterium]
MAPTLLTGGTVVDVLADRLERADVLMEDGVIRLVGSVNPDALPADTEVVDVTGKILCPGFIDGHIHIESTLMVPRELARVCAAHGTAAMVADPHEIANVAGVEGLRYKLETSRGLPVDIFFALPSCVPATPFDESGATLAAADLKPFYACPEVVALGEVMNVPGILMGIPEVIEKIEDYRSRGLVVDGHAPLVSGPALNACIYMGVQSDHESTHLEEAREKLRRGMFVMIREGSSEKNLDELISLVNPHNARRLMFASDDLDPTDMIGRGHINHLVKRAVAAGVDPICALQMATLNPATYFGIGDRLGAIFAGAQA